MLPDLLEKPTLERSSRSLVMSGKGRRFVGITFTGVQRLSRNHQDEEASDMYFLKTGSPVYLRWLKVFEPLMVITGIVQPLATLPSISKLYFTHSQHASGQSLTTWSIFAIASLLWVTYGLLNRKPAIYVGNIIGLVMNLLMVNGILMNAGWTY